MSRRMRTSYALYSYEAIEIIEKIANELGFAYILIIDCPVATDWIIFNGITTDGNAKHECVDLCGYGFDADEIYAIRHYCDMAGQKFRSIYSDVLLSKVEVAPYFDLLTHIRQVGSKCELFNGENNSSMIENEIFGCDLSVCKYTYKNANDMMGKSKFSVSIRRYNENNDTKSFDVIDASVPIVSRGNPRQEVISAIKHFKKDLDKMVVRDISESKRFQRFGVPVNVLKNTNTVYTKDGLLQYTFVLKLEN